EDDVVFGVRIAADETFRLAQARLPICAVARGKLIYFSVKQVDVIGLLHFLPGVSIEAHERDLGLILANLILVKNRARRSLNGILSYLQFTATLQAIANFIPHRTRGIDNKDDV